MSYRVGLVWCDMRYAGWMRDGEECKEIFWCHQPGIALGKFSPRTWPIINPFHFVNPSSSAHGIFVIGFFGLCEAHHLRVQISYVIPISIELGQNTPASKTPSGHQATTTCRVDNLNQAERWRRVLTSTNHKAYFRLLPFPSNTWSLSFLCFWSLPCASPTTSKQGGDKRTSCTAELSPFRGPWRCYGHRRRASIESGRFVHVFLFIVYIHSKASC